MPNAKGICRCGLKLYLFVTLSNLLEQIRKPFSGSGQEKNDIIGQLLRYFLHTFWESLKLLHIFSHNNYTATNFPKQQQKYCKHVTKI